MGKKRGMTLLELLLVMFIIGVLVSNVIVTFGPAARVKAYQSAIDRNLGVLKIAVAAYFQEEARYPVTINDLVTKGILESDPTSEPGITYVLEGAGSIVGIRNVSPYAGGYVKIGTMGERTVGGWEVAVATASGGASGGSAVSGSGSGSSGSVAPVPFSSGTTSSTGGAALSGIPGVSAKGLVTKEATLIASAAGAYASKYAKSPTSVEDLISSGSLNKAPSMPGVKYSIDEKGNILAKVVDGPFKDSFVLISKNKIYAEGWQDQFLGEKRELAVGEGEAVSTAEDKSSEVKADVVAEPEPAAASNNIMKWFNIIIVGLVVYFITKLVIKRFNKSADR